MSTWLPRKLQKRLDTLFFDSENLNKYVIRDRNLSDIDVQLVIAKADAVKAVALDARQFGAYELAHQWKVAAIAADAAGRIGSGPGARKGARQFEEVVGYARKRQEAERGGQASTYERDNDGFVIFSGQASYELLKISEAMPHGDFLAVRPPIFYGLPDNHQTLYLLQTTVVHALAMTEGTIGVLARGIWSSRNQFAVEHQRLDRLTLLQRRAKRQQLVGIVGDLESNDAVPANPLQQARLPVLTGSWYRNLASIAEHKNVTADQLESSWQRINRGPSR